MLVLRRQFINLQQIPPRFRPHNPLFRGESLTTLGLPPSGEDFPPKTPKWTPPNPQSPSPPRCWNPPMTLRIPTETDTTRPMISWYQIDHLGSRQTRTIPKLTSSLDSHPKSPGMKRDTDLFYVKVLTSLNNFPTWPDPRIPPNPLRSLYRMNSHSQSI